MTAAGSRWPGGPVEPSRLARPMVPAPQVMVHAPEPPGYGARAWGDRRVISPGLAQMLVGARRARGLSLRAAAKRAGCSAGTIVHLEKARRAPSVATAWGIISAYGLYPDQADRLLAEAADDAGKSSPWKTG